jgi:class 3 adenylate cyclase
MTACRSCGSELLDNARFCHVCGTAHAVTDTRAEYKQVTILFADVVHSMDIAAAVDTERLREIMTELVDCSSAIVRRYGGTVDKFTGDGIMAVFGAPAALEDHALRACLAALGIQNEIKGLAPSVQSRDGVTLQLRVGLNSGEVIAGDVGTSAPGYTAVGEQVGMAQRMESVAPPGGVMLSASTARLVKDAALLSEPLRVHIKGNAESVPAQQLLSITAHPRRDGPAESTLVGRDWEMAALSAMLERSIDGRGSVVGVVGPAGIGKSRIAHEIVQQAESHGAELFSTFCESHATDVAFHAVARLLRAVGQVDGLDDRVGRVRLRERFADTDPEDMLLLDDLLGIADPAVEMPKIDPDARRRRLTALINTAQLARARPALIVVEDVHWIDEASESLLADLLAMIPQTRSMVLLTYRPEYRGQLRHAAGAQTLALAPLSEAETSTLVAELVGSDPSVAEISQIIAGRAAGNAFFAQEITHELVGRGVLVGERGRYTSSADVLEIQVPATLQATIAARIDRLRPAAKDTIAAAAVVGSRFSPDLLRILGIDPSLEELIAAELVDQVQFAPGAEYAFRHPLIRAVAYAAQLKADRAATHRRLANAIEARDPDTVDQNAALLAEHLEAAGDQQDAYAWHMRAAAWAINRDAAAARMSCERAMKIADALPADDPDRLAMRIAPRTMLCGFAWRVHMNIAGAHFDELRELCTAAGDKASLATAMAGLVMDHIYAGRVREASESASDAMALIEAVDDPVLTAGLSFAAIHAKGECTEWQPVLSWSQRVIDLADGNPSYGNLIVGSPLALALTTRGMARYFRGRPGWRDDLRQGLTLSRGADPASYAMVAAYFYCVGIPCGVLAPDDAVVGEIEEALSTAERSVDGLALSNARMTLGMALVHRASAFDRDRGMNLLLEVGDAFVRGEYSLAELPLVNAYSARETARRGDHDGAILLVRESCEELFRQAPLSAWALPATGVLVETLLARGTDDDVTEAASAIERLAAGRTDDGSVLLDVWLLRLRAMLARARGDVNGYTRLRDGYRDIARQLEFEGHIAWAAALPSQ